MAADVHDPYKPPLSKNDTPMSEPDDIPVNDQGLTNDTHQSTDSNLDVTQEYHEGLSGAAEASEPNLDDTVKRYHPHPEEDESRAA